MTLATIHAIWIGPKLGPVHAACLRSFVRQGHRTILHVYERPADTPDGVEFADAGELLPASRIIRYSQGGGLSIFANLLRLEILKKGLGLYVDCDVFCLRPVEDADYIYGWESESSINNAILKLPPDSPALDSLRAIKDARAFLPPWIAGRRGAYYRWRARLGMPVRIQDMPWGTTGPHALTWYLRQHGLEARAAPIDVFYPVHYTQAALFVDPGLSIDDVTTSRTSLLHLYNEKLKTVDLSRLPPTSPLGRMLAS